MQEDLKRKNAYTTKYVPNVSKLLPEFDLCHFVRDSLSHFYQTHEKHGYKKCICSACQNLAFPVLIKN